MDNAGRCVAVNRAACELWDLPQSALCDRAITDFTDPNAALSHLWPLGSQTALLLRGEGCLYCSPTRTRQVAFALAINTWPDHHLLTLCDRPQAAQSDTPKASQHEHSEYRPSDWLETVLEAIPDPIFLKDSQGGWQLVNQAALDLLQLTRSDYQGHTDAELAQQMPFYREVLLACIESDEAAWAHQGLLRTEAAIPQPTGEIRTFDVYKVPLFHADGSRQGMVVVGRDISDRKRAEADLRESENRLRLILALTGIGFWQWNPQTGAYYWSEQVTQLTELPLGLANMYETWLSRVDPAMREAIDRTLTYSAEELAQLDFAAITHPDDLVCEQVLVDECVAGQRQHYQIASPARSPTIKVF